MGDRKFHISPEQEVSLLKLVANGDETAFSTLLKVHWFHIYHYAVGFLKSPESAEEFTQDVFVRLWQNREKLADVKSFSDYLFIVSRNLLFTRLKKRVATGVPIEDLHLLETTLLPDQQFSAKELSEIIARAIGRLPPQQKTVFQYVYHDKFSYEEISEIMQISKRTVRFHRAAAIAYLRSYIHFEYNSEGKQP